MNFMSKRQEQRCSQFQGNKKKARKTAYLKREKKRQMNSSLLPVLYESPRLPVLNTIRMVPEFFDYELMKRRLNI